MAADRDRSGAAEPPRALAVPAFAEIVNAIFYVMRSVARGGSCERLSAVADGVSVVSCLAQSRSMRADQPRHGLQGRAPAHASGPAALQALRFDAHRLRVILDLSGPASF